MPANFDALNAAITQLSAQVTATVGVEQSATVLITGFAAAVTAAVTKALQADAAANQTSIDAASAAIAQATAAALNPTNDLASAVAANPAT